MKTEIQRYPFGLLSLLDAKNGGRTPPLFGDELWPTLDASPFYFGSIPLTTKSSDQLAVAITANTGYAILTIPTGEAWQILCATAVVNNASGAIAALTATLNLGSNDGSGNTPVAKFGPEALPNASKYCDAIWLPPPPQVFGPGTTLYVVLSETIAVTTVDCHVRAAVRVLRT